MPEQEVIRLVVTPEEDIDGADPPIDGTPISGVLRLGAEVDKAEPADNPDESPGNSGVLRLGAADNPLPKEEDQEAGVIVLIRRPETEPLTPLEAWKKASSDFQDPFDNPELAEQLEGLIPGFAEIIKGGHRPKLSQNPDEFELWESAAILARKGNLGESTRGYLQRRLYEEAFSVTQFHNGAKPPKWEGETGATPGGLLSHYYLNSGRWGESMDILVEDLDWSGDDLGEVFKRFSDEGVSAENLERVLNSLHSMHMQRVPRSGSFEEHPSSRDVLDGEYKKDSVWSRLDPISLRLLQMLQSAPDMRADVEDDELVKRIPRGYHPDARPNKAELLLRTWTASQPLLTPEGTYNKSEDPAVLRALNDLLYFRTHPEMQVFFRYLSPSGYINAARNSAQGEKSLE